MLHATQLFLHSLNLVVIYTLIQYVIRGIFTRRFADGFNQKTACCISQTFCYIYSIICSRSSSICLEVSEHHHHPTSSFSSSSSSPPPSSLLPPHRTIPSHALHAAAPFTPFTPPPTLFAVPATHAVTRVPSHGPIKPLTSGLALCCSLGPPTVVCRVKRRGRRTRAPGRRGGWGFWARGEGGVATRDE